MKTKEKFERAQMSMMLWETEGQTRRVQAVLDLIPEYDLEIRALEALGYVRVAQYEGLTLWSHLDTAQSVIHDYATGLCREPINI